MTTIPNVKYPAVDLTARNNVLDRPSSNLLFLLLVLACMASGTHSFYASAQERDSRSERVLMATSLLFVEQGRSEQMSVSITLRVPGACVDAHQPGPEKGLIVIKAAAGDSACVLRPSKPQLLDATRKHNWTFRPAHSDFSRRARDSDERSYSIVANEDRFGLQRRERPQGPYNRFGSPTVFMERGRSTSLVRIWCYGDSRDKWLCILHLQPTSRLLVEGRIKFGELHRWRELVEEVEGFVKISLQGNQH